MGGGAGVLVEANRQISKWGEVRNRDHHWLTLGWVVFKLFIKDCSKKKRKRKRTHHWEWLHSYQFHSTNCPVELKSSSACAVLFLYNTVCVQYNKLILCQEKLLSIFGLFFSPMSICLPVFIHCFCSWFVPPFDLHSAMCSGLWESCSAQLHCGIWYFFARHGPYFDLSPS